MNSTIIEFAAILFTALALVPSGAHLMELPNKIALPGEQYRIVQQIYRGWALSGVLVVAALITTAALSWTLRGQAGFMAALVAVLCIVGTQIVFWLFIQPMSRLKTGLRCRATGRCCGCVGNTHMRRGLC